MADFNVQDRPIPVFTMPIRAFTMVRFPQWAKRRLRVPKGVLRHHDDVPRNDRVEIGAVLVTNVRRTLLDCAGAHVSPELVEVAIQQAHARTLIDTDDVKAIRARGRDA